MIPILLTSFAFVSPVVLPVSDHDPEALKKEQEEAWKDLASFEQRVASRAILKLLDHPAETVTFLKGVMKPLKIDKETVKKLIADLNSDFEKDWKPAVEKFEYFDPRLALSLQECFDLSKEGPGRQRMVAVLINEPPDIRIGQNTQLQKIKDDEYFIVKEDGFKLWAGSKVSQLARTDNAWHNQYWARAERAIVLLEHIRTKEAIDVLKTMATGHLEAGPTVAAKEALKRLKAE